MRRTAKSKLLSSSTIETLSDEDESLAPATLNPSLVPPCPNALEEQEQLLKRLYLRQGIFSIFCILLIISSLVAIQLFVGGALPRPSSTPQNTDNLARIFQIQYERVLSYAQFAATLV